MSEVKFTPGPWKRTLYDHGGSRIYGGEDDSELIADTYSKGNSDIIFAAPDMHAALQSALCDDPDWRRLAVDALAKAEGRA